MKFRSAILFACLTSVWAQTPVSQTQPPAVPAAAPAPKIPDLPDETVVAVFDDGTKFTMGDFKKVYGSLPPEN
jgi:hypothetical protein